MADTTGYSGIEVTRLTGMQLYNLLVDAFTDGLVNGFSMIINGEEKIDDVKENGSSLKEIIIKSINGEKKLEDIESNGSSLKEIITKSINGEEKLEDIKSNGSSLKEVFVKSINGEKSLGDIETNGSSLKEVFIKSINGEEKLEDIKVNGSSLKEITIKSINGEKKLEDVIDNGTSLGNIMVKAFTGEKSIADAEEKKSSVVGAIIKTFAGEETLADIDENKSSMKDVISKTVTGLEYEKLDEEQDDLGYKYNLNDRLKKSNEILMGVLTGIYNEDEINDILSKIDTSNKDSIEEAIGKLTEGISMLKLNILENLKFNTEKELIQSSALSEIERAIKGLVVSFIVGDIKSSLKMAKLKGESINLDSGFVNDILKAYDKIASDFVKNINDDTDPSNDGDYTNLGLINI